MADGSKTRSARLPDELNRRVEQYTEEQGMTNSESLRHLIRAGLEAEETDETRTPIDERFLRMAERFAWAAIVLLAAVLVGFVPSLDPLLPVGPTVAVSVALIALAVSSVLVATSGVASGALAEEVSD
jgi:hypothetical protein